VSSSGGTFALCKNQFLNVLQCNKNQRSSIAMNLEREFYLHDGLTVARELIRKNFPIRKSKCRYKTALLL